MSARRGVAAFFCPGVTRYSPRERVRRLWTDLSLQEMSGAMGDLGTLIPLLVSLFKDGKIRLIPALFFAGLFNIITGFTWDIPMPVQPMKSISAAALAGELTEEQVAISGILAGAIVFVLGVSRTVEWLHKIIPVALLYGVQIGVGFKLLARGFELLIDLNSWTAIDSYTTAWVVFLFMAFATHHKRFPAALVVFLIGLLLTVGIIVQAETSVSFEFVSPVFWAPQNWRASDWDDALVSGALPQVPLTTMNSVLAVCLLARDLFPERGLDATEVSVASSVGWMNIVACLFGGMPMCHGSGGLAAQYKFGARTGTSVVYLGILKVLIALVLGSAAEVVLSSFPNSILGLLLIFSGMELASAGRKVQDKGDANLAFLTAAGVLFLPKGTGFGTAVGLIYYVLRGAYRRYFEKSNELNGKAADTQADDRPTDDRPVIGLLADSDSSADRPTDSEEDDHGRSAKAAGDRSTEALLVKGTRSSSLAGEGGELEASPLGQNGRRDGVSERSNDEVAGTEDSTRSRHAQAKSKEDIQMVKVDIDAYDTECGC